MRRAIVWASLGFALVLVGLGLLSRGDREATPPASTEQAETRSARPSAAEPVPPVRDAPADEERAFGFESPDSIAPDDTDGEAAERVPRVDLLVTAGFSRERAADIVRRETELRRAAAYREYETTGTVRALTGTSQLASDTGLRQELGDAEFERYLAALGRPTRVVVAGVAADSAAANAGLIAGDEVLAYGGERVFNLRELNELAQRRSAGETVAATVVRDGQTLRLYVTGGPLGLTLPELR